MDVLTRSGLHHATGHQIPPPSHARRDRLLLRRLAGVLASPHFSHGLSYERLVEGKGDFGGAWRIGLAGPRRGVVFAGAGRQFPDGVAGAGEVFEQTSPSDSSWAILFRGSFRTTRLSSATLPRLAQTAAAAGMGFEWCLCGESSRKSTRCTPGGVKDGRPRAAATGKTRSGWGDSSGAGGCARTSGR